MITRMRLLAVIDAAQLEGLDGLAAALLELYHRVYPESEDAL